MNPQQKQKMKASQTFCKDLEQHGIVDDVGYINKSMQDFAQQFIDQHIEAIAKFKLSHASQTEELQSQIKDLQGQVEGMSLFLEWISENEFKKYPDGWCRIGGSNGWHCTTSELYKLYLEQLTNPAQSGG